MKVKMTCVPPSVDAQEGKEYKVLSCRKLGFLILDDSGGERWVGRTQCEIVRTPSSDDENEKEYTPQTPTTFQKLQQYASELNIDITFLPENKVAVYIDNTLDKTYTVETEDELEELVKALRLVDKYLDKD